MDDKFFEDLREKIYSYFEKTGGHSLDHTKRVYNLALKLSEDEEGFVDLDVLMPAVLMHDIARQKQKDSNDKICHAEEGAKIAQEILDELDFPKEKIPKVVHAIKVHRYSKGLKPETKEAKILQDADRLDALGALIIGRVFSDNGGRNLPMHDSNLSPKEVYDGSINSSSINHFYEKILKIKPKEFHTKKAQQIAKGRYKFVEDFVDRFVKEWEGEL